MAPFPRTTVPAHQRNPGGRPTLYRPEYCDQVVEAAATEGLSLEAFAGMIGVCSSTVYDWIKAHRDFSEACACAKSARILWWERKLGRSTKGASTTAAVFALKNHAPQTWRDIKTTEHKHSVSYEKLTDQQLLAIASGMSPADAGVIDGEAEVIGER